MGGPGAVTRIVACATAVALRHEQWSLPDLPVGSRSRRTGNPEPNDRAANVGWLEPDATAGETALLHAGDRVTVGRHEIEEILE